MSQKEKDKSVQVLEQLLASVSSDLSLTQKTPPSSTRISQHSRLKLDAILETPTNEPMSNKQGHSTTHALNSSTPKEPSSSNMTAASGELLDEIEALMNDLQEFKADSSRRNTVVAPPSDPMGELDLLLASYDAKASSDHQEKERQRIEEERQKIEEERKKKAEEEKRNKEEEEARKKLQLEEERRKRDEEERKRKEDLVRLAKEEEERQRREEEFRRREQEAHARKLREQQQRNHQQNSPSSSDESHTRTLTMHDHMASYTKANEEFMKLLKLLDDPIVPANAPQLSLYINQTVVYGRDMLQKNAHIDEILRSNHSPHNIDPSELTQSIKDLIIYVHKGLCVIPQQSQMGIIVTAKKLVLSAQTIFNAVQLGGTGVQYDQMINNVKSNLGDILKIMKTAATSSPTPTPTLHSSPTPTLHSSPVPQSHSASSAALRTVPSSGTIVTTTAHTATTPTVLHPKDTEAQKARSEISFMRAEMNVFKSTSDPFDLNESTNALAATSKQVIGQLSSTSLNYTTFVATVGALIHQLKLILHHLQLDTTPKNTLTDYAVTFLNRSETYVTALQQAKHIPTDPSLSSVRKGVIESFSQMIKFAHDCISQRRARCFKCNTVIEGEYIQVEAERSCCIKCFKCDTCQEPLSTYYEDKGLLFCKEHYFAQLKKTPGALVCVRCDKVILGQYMKVEDGRVWHKDCFVCSLCEKQLLGMFFEKGPQIRCSDCSNK